MHGGVHGAGAVRLRADASSGHKKARRPAPQLSPADAQPRQRLLAAPTPLLRSFPLLLLRGLFGLTSQVLWYLAMALLPLSDAYALSFLRRVLTRVPLAALGISAWRYANGRHALEQICCPGCVHALHLTPLPCPLSQPGVRRAAGAALPRRVDAPRHV